MVDVMVVGAGIVGAMVAYRLSLAGARVTVLEAERPAAAASRRSFAWVNATHKLPRAYHDLNAVGMTKYPALAASLGGDGWHPVGNLIWATAPAARAALVAKTERLHAWGYDCTLIDRADAARLAPDLSLPPVSEADYAFAPAEGWVEVGPLVGRLLAAATAAGATVRWPVLVERVLMAGGRVTGVVAAGEHHAADWVVDCAGCAAGALLAEHGARPRQRASPGLLIVTEPAAVNLTPVVHAPGLHLRADGNGRLLIGSDEVDATLVGLPPDAPVPGAFAAPARELLLRARALMLALAGVEIESTRLCWRPMPDDGLSAVGPIEHMPGYYLALTHSGVTLAPVLGDLIAAEITGGQPAAALEPFRPGRLLTGA